MLVHCDVAHDLVPVRNKAEAKTGYLLAGEPTGLFEVCAGRRCLGGLVVLKVPAEVVDKGIHESNLPGHLPYRFGNFLVPRLRHCEAEAFRNVPVGFEDACQSPVNDVLVHHTDGVVPVALLTETHVRAIDDGFLSILIARKCQIHLVAGCPVVLRISRVHPPEGIFGKQRVKMLIDGRIRDPVFPLLKYANIYPVHG